MFIKNENGGQLAEINLKSFGWAKATNGDFVYPDAGAQTYTYDPSGNISTASFVDVLNGNTYLQTYTWTSGNLTSVSAWVKQ